MPENDPKPSLESVEARLEALRDKQTKAAARDTGRSRQSQGLGLGMRIGIELVASVLVSVGIGLMLDNWLDTVPIFTLALVSLGFAAGVMNVIRISRGLDQRIGLGRAVRDKQAVDTATGAPTDAQNEDKAHRNGNQTGRRDGEE